MDVTKRQQYEAQKRKEDLEEDTGDDDDGNGSHALRVLALKEIEKQSCLLEADQVSSAVAFSQLLSGSTDQVISNVITSDDSESLVALPASVVGKVNQRIRNVTTQGKSVAIVGVFDGNIDMRNYFKE